MIGLPGAGKSSWARAYKAANPGTYIIASDEIRRELFGRVQDFRDEARIWQTVEQRIKYYGSLNESLTVIVDAGNRTNLARKHFYEIAKDYDEHIIVYLKRDLATLLDQNKRRSQERIVSEKVIIDFFNAFEEPNDEIAKLYKIKIK